MDFGNPPYAATERDLNGRPDVVGAFLLTYLLTHSLTYLLTN